MVERVDLGVGNEVVAVEFVVDVIPSEFSKHSVPLSCQNLRQKLVILCQHIRLGRTQ